MIKLTKSAFRKELAASQDMILRYQQLLNEHPLYAAQILAAMRDEMVKRAGI